MNTFRFTCLVLIFALSSALFTKAEAQLRREMPSPFKISGPTLISEMHQRDSSRLFGLVNVSMAHSYEMTMSSFGGNMYNQNMYTNTLFLNFNENLNGRVDLAFAHSPFGMGLPGANQGSQIFVRNAELNYSFNDRTHVRLQFSQMPRGAGLFGYNDPFGFNGHRGAFFGRGYDPFYGPY
jgi:hypothetical protein